MVGAVVVAGRHIVGRGYHRRAGGPHAEIVALDQAGHRAHGATLYVTLEPCCHSGKRTPPCVPAVIAAGIRRVVVAMKDPNPQVSGRGIQQLRRSGIHVDLGCLHDQAERLNEAYIFWVQTGRPFVVMKAAMTLDGKIATASGESKWITGETARAHVHELRSQVDAILVGIGTVLKDDPQLTARVPRRVRRSRIDRQPVRVVLDTHLRVPLSAHVLTWMVQHPTILATTKEAPPKKIDQLRQQGAHVLVLPANKGKVSLKACLAHLGRMGLTSVLVEGGSEVFASVLRQRLVNKVMLYVSPKFLGGQESKSLIGGITPKRLNDAIPVKKLNWAKLGEDFVVTGYGS